MAAVIFGSGTELKTLRNDLNLNDNAKILQGTDDPTSVAKDAPIGSIYLRTGASGGDIYKKLDAGSTTNWEILGTGGSGINHITNENADGGTTGWAAYADAAASTPVDGTGGSPTVTITRSTTTPLRGTGSFLLTKDAANRQGEGVSSDFTIDRADRFHTLNVSFDYEIGSGTYADDDVAIFIYDVTNTTLITPDQSGLNNVANQGRYTTTFAATDSTSYRLILHVASTSASAYTLEFDNVRVTPDKIAVVANTDDWKEFTMTIDGATTAPTKATSPDVDKALWRRVGDSMEIMYEYRHSSSTGAADGSGIYLFKLPTGYTIDTTKLAVSTSINDSNTVGHTYSRSATASDELWGTVNAYDSTSLMLIIPSSSTNPKEMTFISSSDFPMTTANIKYGFKAIVPISGWSSNFAFSSSQPNVVAIYESDAGQSISNGSNDVIDFEDKIVDSHNAVTTGASWVFTAPVAGQYRVSAKAAYTSTTAWDAGESCSLRLLKNASGHRVLDFIEIQDGTTELIASLGGTVLVDLSSGDTLAVDTTQNTGGALTLLSDATEIYICIEKVGTEVTVANNSPVKSMIHVETPNGFGSTNTAIRIFTNVIDNIGTAITRATSAADGDSYTINEDGVYSVSYTDRRSSATSFFGISKNSNQLTTAFESITSAHKLIGTDAGASVFANTGCSVFLSRGDVIRPHGNLNQDAADANARFIITQVSR